ncbi:AMP-binding protein [Mariniluteicoccus flavus]
MSDFSSRVDALLTEVSGPVAPAALLCDRHPADQVAFTVIEPDLSAVDLTYGELKESSERMAAALAALGVGPGDRVATLMGKSAAYATVVLGIWRLGAVLVPLFTAFAPSGIAARLVPSDAKVVIADSGQVAKLAPSTDIPADASWQVVVAGDAGDSDRPALDALLAAQEPGFPAATRKPDDDMVHLFTSGTTGHPKAVPVPVRALAAFQGYLEFGLDVRADDVFWNVADPGWAYGLYYGILGPLVMGRRNLLLKGGFAPETTWKVLERFGVTNLAAAPTVFRALRAAGAPEGPKPSLRVISSAGEPLNPEIMTWAEKNLGQTIRDHYGQTEMGMCVINCWADGLRRELNPGSMGRPMPGFEAAILDNLHDREVTDGSVGRVALRIDTPLMWFPGYAYGDERSSDRFSPDGVWYFTGDAGRRDDDGDYFFSAREDDVILMAGYRIGPFEVESTLVTHPAVAESAAIGVPDELRGEVLEAYVVLLPGHEASDALAAELQQHVKQNYAAHAYPRQIHFVPELPKTPSGKVRRVELRAMRAEGPN